MFYGLILACTMDAGCIVYKDESDVFKTHSECVVAVEETYKASEPLIKEDFKGEEVLAFKICGTRSDILKEFPFLHPDLPLIA